MEGFVTIRTTFGGYSKVWMVLDGQQLSYYEDFDLPNQCPKKLKGTMNVKEGEIKKFSDDAANIKHGLKIKSMSKGVKISKLQCSLLDAALCSSWYNALHRAINLHKEEEDRMNKPIEFKKILKIEEKDGEKLTQGLIAKAYKKLCLSAHPDKGGDPALFNQIRHAYTELTAIQQLIDEQESTVAVQYEALIEKLPGLGLGISVIEDKLKRQIVVSSVNEKTRMHGITEDSHGEIKAGDILVGIDNDDCSLWWLSRIRARLDNYRIPMNSKVLLTFERRIPKDELDSYLQKSQEQSPEHDESELSNEEDSEIEEKSDSDMHAPRSQREAEELADQKRREAASLQQEDEKAQENQENDDRSESTGNNKHSKIDEVEDKPLPTIILSPAPPPTNDDDDSIPPPAPPLSFSPGSSEASTRDTPTKKVAATTLQLDDDDDEEVEVEYVLKEDYDLKHEELTKVKSDLEEIRIQAFGMTERIAELESTNNHLQHYCAELQESNSTLSNNNERLRKENDELIHQNASLKNVVDSQFHTMSSQNMKNYLLVLQQKVLDFDMQQRELLHRLESNNNKALAHDAVRETHYLRKQHYQANEQRAKVLEEKLKGLCLAMEHRKR